MKETKEKQVKVTSYKGFKIQELQKTQNEKIETVFNVFTADEWSMGKGFRYAEWEAGTMEEAKQFIDCY